MDLERAARILASSGWLLRYLQLRFVTWKYRLEGNPDPDWDLVLMLIEALRAIVTR